MESDRDILLMSLFTFLTVSLWIFFELFKTYNTSTITATVQQSIVQLTPTLDMATLDALAQKQAY